MIFQSSPYYPLVKRLRRLMGDEENPAGAFTLSANGSTQLTLRVSYTDAVGMTSAAQVLTITPQGGSATTFDLTSYPTIRELLLDLDGLVISGTTLAAQYVVNPLRTNNPLDLLPGKWALNAAPNMFYTRHYLADEDLVDDLNGALTQFGPDYTFDPAQATQLVTNASGQQVYPYPNKPAYPYPPLASSPTYLCPTNVGYFVCFLAASYGLTVIANRYSRLPAIYTEDATIDRQVIVSQLRDMASEMYGKYNTAMEQTGLSIDIYDLTRVSSRLNILSQTPELDPDVPADLYGLRWLSMSIPNLVQPVTQQNAHAYNTNIGSFFETPAIGLGFL
jgi:hypothetical protein